MHATVDKRHLRQGLPSSLAREGMLTLSQLLLGQARHRLIFSLQNHCYIHKQMYQHFIKPLGLIDQDLSTLI